jgi:simple sugar transport system permease protein
MVVGAFAEAAVAYYAGDPWIGFLCARLGRIAARPASRGSVHNTQGQTRFVSGIAINFIGPGLSLFISRLIFDGATQTLTVKRKIPRPFEGFFGEGGLFPHASFFDQVFNKEATVFIAFALAFAVWFLLYRTRLGLRIRAVGEHPEAADTLGISVSGIRYFSVVLSGFLAGLGGAAMSIAVVSQFSPTVISGHGFIAMAR